MTRSAARSLVVALALTTCSHPRPRSAVPEVFWPPPPESPRARLAAIWPEPPLTDPPKPTWRRALAAIVGVEDSGGAPPRLLERPFDVAIGPTGEIVVADPDGPTVLGFGPDGATRRIACASEPWMAPMALHATSEGTLYVADAGAAQITRIERGGRCEILGRGALERPTGIAVLDDHLYVADPPRHCVVVLDARGEVVTRLGTRGEGDGQLSFPTAVAVTPDGEILVVDALNFRIARFSPEGGWLGSFGAPGDTGGAFVRPKGIAAGEDGRIYVSDAQRDTVLVFRPDGRFEFAVGEGGVAPGRFAHPAGLAVAGATLLVADSHNRRIQTFDLLAGGGS